MNPDTIIEVVMKKDMTYSEALKLIESPRAKGWKVTLYQKGFHNPGLKRKVKK